MYTFGLGPIYLDVLIGAGVFMAVLFLLFCVWFTWLECKPKRVDVRLLQLPFYFNS